MIIKCTKKFRNKHNQIIGYELMDQNGQTKQVRPDVLKEVIRQRKLEVSNLMLTSDNRLIDRNIDANTDRDKTIKAEVKPLKAEYLTREIVKKVYKRGIRSLEFKSGVNLEAVIPKSNMLGFSIIKLTDTSFLIDNTHGKRIIISAGKWTLPKDCSYLFEGVCVDHINIKEIDTHEVVNMHCMFEGCQAQLLDLSSFDTANTMNLRFMFSDCKVKLLKLERFFQNWINHFLQQEGGSGDDDKSDESGTTFKLD